MTKPLSATRPSLTKGVTLVEVIFAIGVVLIGLLGLLSILPLAGQRGRDAISLSVGAEYGDRVMTELTSRDWLSNASAAASGATGTGARLVPFANPAAIDFEDLSELPAICIDPLYVAQQDNTTVPFAAYVDRNFPYYGVNYDSLTNPSAVGAQSTWPTTISVPRMLRVGVSSAPSLATLDVARALVERSDDLVVSQPEDGSLPPSLSSLEAAGSLYGKSFPSGEYTWLVTIDPSDEANRNSRFASVSVVVIRQRDYRRDFPDATVTDPEQNGVAERTAYVTQAAGFRGGAGGSVTIASSAQVVADVSVGDWVMLSARAGDEPVHRWYRVLSSSGGDRTVDVTAANLGCLLPPSYTPPPNQAWVGSLTLDGPDWDFGLANDNASDDNTFRNNTFMTIIPGVVSVTERLIPLSDL